MKLCSQQLLMVVLTDVEALSTSNLQYLDYVELKCYNYNTIAHGSRANIIYSLYTPRG